MNRIPIVIFLALCLNLCLVAYSQTLDLKLPEAQTTPATATSKSTGTHTASTTRPTATAPRKKSIRVSSTPPPGFETLADPETTLVDLYYGGQPLTTTPATFTPSDVELLEPAGVLSLIPGILNAPEVQIALTGPGPHNAELLCPPEPYPGCGILEPEVAGIVFDIDHFRAYLFIHPDYLERPDVLTQQFLPPSEAGFSFIQLFNLSVSGIVQEDASYGLAGNTWFSYEANHIAALWYMNEKQIFRLETLKALRDTDLLQYSLGMLRTRGSRLISEQDFIGFGVSSNQATRVNQIQGNSSLLQVFLPLRSRVDIIKQNQLLASNFYEAGYQTLNTDKLPDGAYEVTLKIQDQTGDIREEVHFFSKTADLPPAGQPIYFAEFGLLEQTGQVNQTLPSYSDNWLIHTGTRHRVTDTLGLGAELLLSRDEMLLEGNFTFISAQTRTSGGLMATSLQDFGVAVQSNFHYQHLNGSLSYRHTWHNAGQSQNRRFTAAQNASQQLSAALNYHTPYANFSLNANWNQSDSRPAAWAINPGIRIPLLRRSGVQLDLNIDYTHSSRGNTLIGQLNVYGWNGPWSGRSQLGLRSFQSPQSGSYNEMVGHANLNWNDQDLFTDDLTVRLHADYRGQQSALGTSIRYLSDKTRIQLGAEQQLASSGQASRTLYGGNMSSGFASDLHYFAAGGGNSGQSGVIINLTGSARSGTFEALVDGQSRGFVQASSRTLILLSPYKTYEVKLNPVDTSFTHFDASTRRTTLYPGNIVTLSWQIDQAYVVFARVLYADGTPVSQARVKGVIGVATIEDDGYLQTELDATTRELQIHPLKHPPCTVKLPELNSDEGIIMLDDLICH